MAIVNSKMSTPPNKLWFKFRMFLGAIVAQVIMGIVFFLVVTPISLVMKIMGKDLLNKKYDKKKKTYWIKRETPIGPMKRQF